jgi:hypothetical protein
VAGKELVIVRRSSVVNSTSYGGWSANFMDFVAKGWPEASMAIFKSHSPKGGHAGSVRFAFLVGFICFIPGTAYGLSESSKSLSSGLPLFLRISRLKNISISLHVGFVPSLAISGSWLSQPGGTPSHENACLNQYFWSTKKSKQHNLKARDINLNQV